MPAAEVTSRDVNRALREWVWPAMKKEGFTRRTARRAWRDGPEQIDVVDFWSHSAYSAGVLGVTTYSFQLHLGVHPLCRTTEDTPEKDGHLRPQERACDFRRSLHRNFPQDETDRPEIWFVRPDGSNLDQVIEAARDLLLNEGLAWFASLRGLERMLAIARSAPESMDGTWGMGNLGSPARLDLVTALEAAVAGETPS